ncbi:Metallo-dependent phosphatase-like protein [Mariannaea sp. PMI_226]|nr:Metallo-dependent phosphatase-like protein [Mariannaea sp. PMI_226]
MLSKLFILSSLVAASSQLPQAEKNIGSDRKLQKPLTFDRNGDFQITVFNDLHFGEGEEVDWGPDQDVHTVKVINNVLNKESPDLVVFNGDLITGENVFLHNATHYVDMMTAPVLKRGLTWASTFGNHDYDRNISGTTIMEREHKIGGNLARTQSMVSGRNAGVSNYYLPVYDPKCKTSNCKPLLILWFFDSRGGNYYQKGIPDNKIAQPNWVDKSVVNWFKATNKQFGRRFGKTIPSLAFVHIPTNASTALQMEHGPDSINPNYQPGINDDYELAQQSQGWCKDGTRNLDCSYGGQDLDFMKAITSTPGLMGVFSGHDHGDTWCYKWDHHVPGMKVTGNGLNLCFGQHTGYGGYGDWIRGSRQIRVSKRVISKSWEVDTWIRLESGDVVGSVTLNSTYGKDWYPATPDTMTHL